MDISYKIINSSIDLVDEFRISNAGKFGSQNLTPTLDTEYISQGGILSDIPLNIDLSTGAISPAAIIRSFFTEISQNNTLSFQSISIGLSRNPISNTQGKENPVFKDGCKLESIRIQNKKFYTEDQQDLFFADIDTLSMYKRSIEDPLDKKSKAFAYEIVQEYLQDKYIILSECVPGGTTTASMVSSILLSKLFPGTACIETPSSSMDNEILDTKRKVINTYIELFQNNFPLESPTSSTLFLLADYYQIFMSKVLYNIFKIFKSLKLKSGKTKIILGGGSQVAAALLFTKFLYFKRSQKDFDYLLSFFELHTTSWIKEAWPELTKRNNLLGSYLSNLTIRSSLTSFKSLPKKFNLYEEGYVKEGCGLGACLCLGEDIGIHGSSLKKILLRDYIHIRNRTGINQDEINQFAQLQYTKV